MLLSPLPVLVVAILRRPKPTPKLGLRRPISGPNVLPLSLKVTHLLRNLRPRSSREILSPRCKVPFVLRRAVWEPIDLIVAHEDVSAPICLPDDGRAASVVDVVLVSRGLRSCHSGFIHVSTLTSLARILNDVVTVADVMAVLLVLVTIPSQRSPPTR